MKQKEEFNIFNSAIFRVLSRVLCRGLLLTFPKDLCIALRQKHIDGLSPWLYTGTL